MPGPGFLDLPVRSAKPRRTGITHVLDRGTPLAQVTELLVQNECYVDVWKFGWGIAYLDPQLAAKLDLLARHRVLASPGGTLLEIPSGADPGVLEAAGVRISMDGKGAWRDNVFVERLWRTIKYEEVYLRAYAGLSEARNGIGRYPGFYNSRRPHSSLDGKTPDQVYFNQPMPKAVAA